MKKTLGTILNYSKPEQLADVLGGILKEKTYQKDDFKMLFFEKDETGTHFRECTLTWQDTASFISTLNFEERSTIMVLRKDATYRVVFYDYQEQKKQAM